VPLNLTGAVAAAGGSVWWWVLGVAVVVGLLWWWSAATNRKGRAAVGERGTEQAGDSPASEPAHEGNPDGGAQG